MATFRTSPETPQNLTLGQLQGNLWGFLFDPNVGLLANLKNVVNNSQGAVISGISYNSNQLSNQITNTTNGINSHINNSTSQLANQLSYVFNSVSNQIASNINSVKSVVDQTENDIKSDARNNTEAIQNYSLSLSDAVKHKIDVSTLDLQAQINNSLSVVRDNIGSQISSVGDTVNSIQQSVESFVGTSIASISDALSSLFTPVIEFVNGLLDLFKKWFEDNVTNKLEDFFDQLTKLQKVHYDLFTGNFPNNPDLLTDMGITNDRGAISSKLILMIFSIPTIIGLFSKITEPSWRDFIYKQEATAQSRIVDSDILIKDYFKGLFNRGQLASRMNLLGYGTDAIDYFIEASRSLLSVGDLSLAYRRGFIDEVTFKRKLSDYGYSELDKTTIESLSHVIPSLSDIITMAVREVFSPQITKEFGQFDDYPSLLTGYAQKQGLSEEWAKNYWAAHWTLPSITQAFEMLHRRVITNEQLNLLLKAQDIMPFWRDKVIAISYNPLTRVDVRRMYRVGVLNRDEVKEAYLDLGYDNRNAERLAEFTVRYETPDSADENSEIRELTKSVILKAYNRNAISRGEAQSRLLNLGYVSNDVELLLTLQDYDKQITQYPDRSKEFNERMGDVIIASYRKGTISRNDAVDKLKASGYRPSDAEIALTFSDLEFQTGIRTSIVGELKQQYIERTINTTELTNMLNNYRFTPEEIRRIISELDIIKNLRSKKPTQAQFEKILALGLIDDSQFKEELRGLGYAEKYLDWMLALAKD